MEQPTEITNIHHIGEKTFKMTKNIISFINDQDPTLKYIPACVIAELAHSLSIIPEGLNARSKISDNTSVISNNRDMAIKIIEMASSAEFTEKISTIPCPLLAGRNSSSYSENELERVAFFLNADEQKWSEKSLFQALKHSAEFEDLMDLNVTENYPSNLENVLLKLELPEKSEKLFGRKTNKSVKSIDAIMIFSMLIIAGVCKKFSIKTTLNDIQAAFIIAAGDLLSSSSSEKSSEISTIISSYIGTITMHKSNICIATRLNLVDCMFGISDTRTDLITEDIREGSHSILQLPQDNDPQQMGDLSIIPFGKFNIEEIEQTYKLISNLPDIIIMRLIPISEIEAIIIAFLQFSLDISSAINPSEELAELRMCELVENSNCRLSISNPETTNCMFDIFNRYTPRDPIFGLRLFACPVFFDTFQTWNINLSCCYPSSKKRELLKNLGFTPIKIHGHPSIWTSEEAAAAAACGDATESEKALALFTIEYSSTNEALVASQTLPSFWPGYHPLTNNKESPISLSSFDDLEDAPSGWRNILTFGPCPAMTAYFVTDIARLFETSGRFELPIKNATAKDSHLLTVRNVLQLKLLSKKMINKETSNRFHWSEESSQAYANLDQAIRKVEARSLTLSEHGWKIKKAIDESGKNVSSIFHQALLALSELSWYMRGWKISKNTATPNDQGLYPFPLSSESTGFEASNEPQLSVNITTAISKFENLINLLTDEHKSLIYEAPLLILSTASVRGGKKITREIPPQFVPVVNFDENQNQVHITIKDQLEIVKEENSILSCIRTSSNTFTASSFFYMIASNFEPGFDIREVDQIY